MASKAIAATKTDSRKISMALVGCGAIAEKGYLPAAQTLQGVEIGVLVDTDYNRAERLAKQFGIPKVVSNMDSIAKLVESVVIATPPHARTDLAKKAFSMGLHVLCEKPLANTGEECRELISAAALSERILAVAHTYRFQPNRRYALELIRQNVLGVVRHVQIEEGGPSDWPTVTGYTFRRELVSGGALLNGGIHSLDTLFWWFGEPLDFEYADDSIGGLESNVRIKMHFSGDIVADFFFSRTTSQTNTIVITGDRGNIMLPIYEPSNLIMNVNGKTVSKKVITGKPQFTDIVRDQLNDFADSIREGRKPFVTGEDGMRAIAFINRCYAIKKGRPLPTKAPIPGVTW